MTTPIQKIQQEFNEAVAEHDELNTLRNDCHERGDVIGEQRYHGLMTECGKRAMDAQAKIKELMKPEPSAT
jgi:hypothetical protein